MPPTPAIPAVARAPLAGRRLAALIAIVATMILSFAVAGGPARAAEYAAPTSEPRTVESTAYCLQGTMASGKRVYDGAVAMNNVPFGTTFEILNGPLAGKIVTVEDRIGHSSQFDVWFESCSAARQYGRQVIDIRQVEMRQDVYADIYDSPHARNIRAISYEGIAGGYADETYRPHDAVLRGQMATFLARGFEIAAERTSAPYDDTGGHTHEESIAAVAEAAIASGYADGTFRPEDIVTRGQMAAFLSRALGLSPSENAPTFADAAGSPHEDAIRAVAEAGIASGYSSESFGPDQPVSRGQMATFIARALGI